VKPGSRTLGVAFSDGAERSRLAGALVRGARTLDDLAFGSCTVGGLDATDAIRTVFSRLDREDVQRVVCAGIAPAWFNLVDLLRLHEALDRPVLAVAFEESPGLEPALRREFDGDALAERLTVYGRLPPRRRVEGVDRPLFVRAAGLDAAAAGRVVRELTVEAGRPEPVRVAKVAARGHREATERA